MNNLKGNVVDGIFYASNSYGIERKDMPQIDFNHMEEYKQYLIDNGTSYSSENVDLNAIKPSQKAIDVGKSLKMLGTAPKRVLLRPMVVSKDSYVIDGHHRYLANVLSGTGRVNIIRVDMNAQELLTLSLEFKHVAGDIKECIAFFGRFNPPTKAHQEIVSIMQEANVDSFVSTSNTEDDTRNPLLYDYKHDLLTEVFNKELYCPMSVNNPMQMLESLIDDGYTNIEFWAGSDRVEHYKDIFAEYNEYVNITVNMVEHVQSTSGTELRASVLNEDLTYYRDNIAEMSGARRYDVYSRLKNILT